MNELRGNVSAGARIGRYRIVRALDPSGGMGADAFVAVPDEVTAEADDAPETHARQGELVIVKRLDGKSASAARATKELTRAHLLRHRANVAVVETFAHADDLVVVFGHDLDGPRLDQIQAHLARQEERLADAAILYLAHQLLSALAEAHEHRQDDKPSAIVHGQLAPDLVRITWAGEVRIVGLGLPSLFDDELRAPLVADYRPPEHTTSRSGAPSGDVYRIGAILWTLFTGRRPPATGQPFPKLATLRRDIPKLVSAAIDKALIRTPMLRKLSCRELVDILEQEVHSIADGTELAWNMEVFRALSLFAGSAPPPDSLPPVASVPPPANHVPAPIPSRPGIGPKSKLEWRNSQPPPKKVTGSDDSVIQRLNDLFDALPMEGSEPGERDDRTSVDAGWEMEDGTEAREAERFSLVGDEPVGDEPSALEGGDSGAEPPTAEVAVVTEPTEAVPTTPDTVPDELRPDELQPRSTTPLPPSTVSAPPTVPTIDSAPPTEPAPDTEPSMDEMRPTRAEGRAEGQVAAPLANIGVPVIRTKTSHPPVSSEPVPSTEPEPGRMASPPPSLRTHKNRKPVAVVEIAAIEPSRDPVREPQRPRIRGVPRTTVAAIAVTCLGIGFGGGWQLKPAPRAGRDAIPPATVTERQGVRTGAAPSIPSTFSTPGASGSGLDAKTAASTAASAAASTASSAAVASASASADPAPSAAPGELPPLPAPDGRDGSELLSYEGYLIVRSPATAEVFAQGINIGNTNERLVTRCRQRNIRLRDATSARWVTPGQSVQIACMATTTIEIQPTTK